jgi:hypothetical protein
MSDTLMKSYNSGDSSDAAKGRIEAGNIDLKKRPIVKNPDGTISTVRSISVNIDGNETLLPTVSPEGKNLNTQEAVQLYKKTGQHLGKFDNPQNATAYAKKLHDAQAKYYK